MASRWMPHFCCGSSSSIIHGKDLSHLRSLLRDLPNDADEQLIHFFRSKFPSHNQNTNQGQLGTKPIWLERAKPWVQKLRNMAIDKDLTKITSEALKVVGASNSVLCALLFVGVALERILAMNPNEEKCLKLLAMMGTTVISLRDMRKNFHHINKDVLKDGLQIVLENCILCCDYLEGSMIYKIWNAKSIEGQILEAQQRLDTILASVNCSGIVELQQRNNYYVVPIDNILETKSPVGLQIRIEEVCKLLSMNEKHMQALAVIISGLGGMGKTTLASASIERLAPSINDFKFSRVIFDNTCSMESGRLSHIKMLQQQLVNNLTGMKQEFGNTADGRSKLKEVLQNTSSFIFIDNVNFINDVEELLPESLVLNQETNLRILITSRDRDVRLKVQKICRVKEYLIQPLCSEDAKKLLDRIVMDSIDGSGQEQFPNEMQMLEEVRDLCCGIPILLHLIGTHLRDDRSLEGYNQIIKELEKGDLGSYSCRHESIPDILLFVYKKLKVDLQNAFLDICKSSYLLVPHFTVKTIHWKIVGLTIGENVLESLFKKGLVQKWKDPAQDNEEVAMVHDILKTMISDEINKYFIYNILNKKDIKGIEKYACFINSEVDCEILDLLHASLRILRIDNWRRMFRSIQGAKIGFRVDNCSYATRNRCQATFVELRALHVWHSVVLPFTSLQGFTNLANLEFGDCDNLTELPSGLCSLTCLRILSVRMCSALVSFPSDFRNLTSLKMLSISGCPNLKGLLDGTNVPQHLKFLEISGCDNMGFPKDLGNLTSLEDCCLSGLREDDDADAVVPFKFPSTSSLKTLSLGSQESLRTLEGDFDKLQNLQKLYLSVYNLTELPVQLCQYATNLKELYLGFCSELNSLPYEISLLTKLHTLLFSYCPQVRVVPTAFQHLTSLSMLRASGITDFTPQLCSCLVNLEWLELWNCSEMENLPENISMLSKLEILMLNNCPCLKNLPQSISMLSALQELQLYNCPCLENLPQSICMLSALQTLTLKDCPELNSLPEDIGMLPNLKKLSLRNCLELKTLPESIGMLTNLEILTCKNIKIKALPQGFAILRILRCLKLRKCGGLTEDSMDIILQLKNLTYLKITDSDALICRWRCLQSSQGISQSNNIVVRFDNLGRHLWRRAQHLWRRAQHLWRMECIMKYHYAWLQKEEDTL